MAILPLACSSSRGIHIAKRKFHQTEMGFICADEWWRPRAQNWINCTSFNRQFIREKRVNEDFSASTKKDAECISTACDACVCVVLISLIELTFFEYKYMDKHYNSIAISKQSHDHWPSENLYHANPYTHLHWNHALHIKLNDVFRLTLIHCMASATISNRRYRQYSIDFVRAWFWALKLQNLSLHLHTQYLPEKSSCHYYRQWYNGSCSLLRNHTNVFAFTIHSAKNVWLIEINYNFESEKIIGKKLKLCLILCMYSEHIYNIIFIINWYVCVLLLPLRL